MILILQSFLAIKDCLPGTTSWQVYSILHFTSIFIILIIGAYRDVKYRDILSHKLWYPAYILGFPFAIAAYMNVCTMMLIFSIPLALILYLSGKTGLINGGDVMALIMVILLIPCDYMAIPPMMPVVDILLWTFTFGIIDFILRKLKILKKEGTPLVLYLFIGFCISVYTSYSHILF